MFEKNSPKRKEVEVAVESNNSFVKKYGLHGLEYLVGKFGEVFCNHTCDTTTSIQATLPSDTSIDQLNIIAHTLGKVVQDQETFIYVGIHCFDSDDNQVDVLPGTDEWVSVEDERWSEIDEPPLFT